MVAAWHRRVNDIDLCHSPKSPKKIYKTPYIGVQDHSTSLNSAPIESQCMTSYYLAPLCVLTFSELLVKNRKFCPPRLI